MRDSSEHTGAAVRLLRRYICREFFRFFGIGLAGCVALFVLVELFDRIDEFIERRVFWYDAGFYLASRLPDIVYQLTPVAFLLASVLTFSTLNRGNEITVMRAVGIAPLHLVRPLVLLGVGGGLMLLVAQEYLVPYTNQTTRMIWRTRIRNDKIATRLGLFKQGQIWYRTANRVWSVQLSKPLGQRLLGVIIYVLDDAGTIRQRYDATEAQWDAQGWVLRQGTVRTFNPDGSFAGAAEAFTWRRFSFPERFAEVSAIQKLPTEMSNREIWAYAQRLRRQGMSDASYLTEFYGRIAFATTCIIMAGFGLPLAVRLNRSGGTTKAVSLTVFSGFSYWVMHSFAMALGHNGQFPPILAAWSTNVCFGSLSAYLAYRSQ